MAMYKLSTTRINKLIRQGRKGKYGDGGNLWLEVAGVDVASWLFRWKDRVTKKDRSISYGPWHTVSLEDARKLALADRKLLLADKDPKAERDRRIEDDRIARGLAKTVRQVVEEYDNAIIAHHARNTQITARRMLRIVNRTIGDMPITKINRQIILDDVGLAELWEKKHPTGKALQSQLVGLCGFAIDKGYIPTGYNPALWEHLKRSLPKSRRVHKTKHHDALPYKLVSRFVEKLRAYQYTGRKFVGFKGRPPVALVLEFIVLTGARPGEVRQARWKEIDWDSMIWSVPPEHLKMGHFHGKTKQVPITKPMLAVLEHAKQIAYPQTSAKKYGEHVKVFERARHAPDQSPDALIFPNLNNEVFDDPHFARFMRAEMKVRNGTPHGFRSTLRDWMRAETQFKEVLWKIQVDHIVGDDKSDQSYGHDKLLDQRRAMMELWGEYCSKPAPEPKATGKLLKLSDKRRTA
jgi:integrase